jgi:hypothetical protein
MRSWPRTGACGVKPGMLRRYGGSGQTPGKAVRLPARNWRRRGDFPDRIWDELEGLPQPLRNAAHRAIFHLLEEPVPTLADPFPELDPLPGAYRLHLPSDGLTIWYTVTERPDGQVVIVVQYVKADT